MGTYKEAITDLLRENKKLKTKLYQEKVASSSARWELKDLEANRRGDQVTIGRLMDDIKSLKATTAREKVASIELEASDKGRYFMELYKGQDN
jgi:hypothetical protein